MMPAILRSPWAWLPPAAGCAALAAIGASGSNRALFLWLNHAGAGVGDLAWLHLTMVGDGAVALALVLPLIRRAPRLFWAALIAALVAAAWTQLAKQVVDVPRPLSVFPPTAFHQAGPAFRHVSFPSGHAAAVFALAGIWIMGRPLSAPRRLGLLGLATLVALSRIMIGVHWPVDVLWGMLGGWLGAWTGLAVQARRRWRTTGAGGVLAGLALVALAASLLVSRHLGIPAVLTAQRLLGVVCAALGAQGIGQVMMVRLRAARLRYRRQGPPLAPGRALGQLATLPPAAAGRAAVEPALQMVQVRRLRQLRHARRMPLSRRLPSSSWRIWQLRRERGRAGDG